MIARLTLDHWKSHAHTELRFSKGTQLFVGIMGSGKTSVMEAISFALFGTFPALKRRAVRIEEVIMARPVAAEKASVEIEFEFNGKNYRVRRTISKKDSSEAQVFCDGKLLEAQPQRATELLEGLLATDYELFSRIIFAEQNRIDALLTAQKGERKRQVDDLLGLSRFEAARANANSLANDLRERARQQESFLEGADATGLERERVDNHLRLEELESARQTAARQVEESQKAASEREKSVVEWEKRERAAYALEKKAQTAIALENNARAQKEKLEKQLAGQSQDENAEFLEQAWKELETQEQTARKKHGEIGGEIALGRGELAVLERLEVERKANEKKLEQVRLAPQRAKQLQTEWETLVTHANQRAQRQEELNRTLAALAIAHAECPTCQTPLSDDRHRQLQRQAQEQQRQLTEKLKEDDLRKKKLEKELAAALETSLQAQLLERTLAASTGTEEKIGVGLEKIRQATARATETEKELAKLNAESTQARQKAYQARQIQQMRAQLHTLAQAQSQHAKEQREAAAQLADLAFDPQELARARQELATAQQERSARAQALRGLEEHAGELRRRESELERRQNELRARQEQARALQGKAEKAGRFSRSIIETQKLLREELVGALNQSLAQVWPALYPYGDYRSLRLQTQEDDYALEIQNAENEWQGIEACSGGERSCAGLALRVAFALVLAPGTPWLILDEPTHNLDRQAVAKLADALREHLPALVEQVFIVTHDESLKEGASAKTFLFERDKDASAATQVEELSAAPAQS